MQLRSFWNPWCWGLGNFISLVITSNILYCSIFSNTFNKHDDKDTSRKLSGDFFLSYCLLCIWVRLYLFSFIRIFVNNEYSKYDGSLSNILLCNEIVVNEVWQGVGPCVKITSFYHFPLCHIIGHQQKCHHQSNYKTQNWLVQYM